MGGRADGADPGSHWCGILISTAGICPATIEQAAKHVAEHVRSRVVDTLLSEHLADILRVHADRDLLKKDASQHTRPDAELFAREHAVEKPAGDLDMLSEAALDQVGDRTTLVMVRRRT